MSAIHDIAAKLRKITRVSKRVKLDMLRDALEMDPATFNRQVFDWAAEFGFRLDGDYADFAESDVEAFIRSLDAEFAAWGSAEKTGAGKAGQMHPPPPSPPESTSAPPPPSPRSSPARQKCEYLLQVGQMLVQKGQFAEALAKLRAARQACDEEVFDAALLQNIEEVIAAAEERVHQEAEAGRRQSLAALERLLGQSVADFNASGWTSLDLWGKGLTSLPEALGDLKSLKCLNLELNQLTSLPESIGQLNSLERLDLGRNQLTSLPESFRGLQSLQILSLAYNKFTSLPESLGQLHSLQELNLGYNKLSFLPESLGQLHSLQRLDLDHNQLTFLPESLGQLHSLQILYLDNNKLTFLPESLGQLHSLQELILYNNQLTSLPESIGQLHSLRALSLHGNQLSSLPETVKRALMELKKRGCSISGMDM